jgi:cytochrome c biogenesis protein CcdA/thiol-disulfide isomerase/thioredoxin
MTLFLISLLAGLLTVLSPCVLPLLPVIVGGSISGGTSLKRALTVTAALGISVFLFTFILKVSTAFINVPASFWTWFSGILVILVGLATLFPSLLDRLTFLSKINRDSNRALATGYKKQNFWGDVLVGAALGPVFSSCSPTYFIVLATVLPASLALGVLDIFAYVLGLCVSLLIVAFVGQKVVEKLGVASDPNGWFKKALGILFILVGLAIITGLDKKVEAPLYSLFDETTIEQSLLKKDMPPSVVSQFAQNLLIPGAIQGNPLTVGTSTDSSPGRLTLAMKDARYPKAPELVTPDGYLNTGGKPITLAQYRGKDVVLIDFWTYSCINCQRTLPYLTTWYSKYKDQGLVIIGVHTPEFAFEHVESNVAAALKQFGITYPVVLDNEYQTWNAYGNSYWPREYLVDIDGYIVHDHAGEGAYDITEKAIQDALAERNMRLNTGTSVPTSISSPTVDAPLAGMRYTPESYFEPARNSQLGNGAQGSAGKQTLTIPTLLAPDMFYLSGTWNFKDEYAEATAGARVALSYNAKDAYFVASSAAGTGSVVAQVLLDGAPISKNMMGADVSADGTITIAANRLYAIVKGSAFGAHRLDLIIKSGTLDAYTFTFG